MNKQRGIQESKMQDEWDDNKMDADITVDGGDARRRRYRQGRDFGGRQQKATYSNTS